MFVDVDGHRTVSTSTAPNPSVGRYDPGQVPEFIRSQGATVVITGGMGARALAFFKACGIEQVTGASGTVRQAIQDYLSGRLQGSSACKPSTTHSP